MIYLKLQTCRLLYYQIHPGHDEGHGHAADVTTARCEGRDKITCTNLSQRIIPHYKVCLSISYKKKKHVSIANLPRLFRPRLFVMRDAHINFVASPGTKDLVLHVIFSTRRKRQGCFNLQQSTTSRYKSCSRRLNLRVGTRN